MECEKLRQEFMEAVLSDRQSVSPEMQEHLRTCAACAGELASLQQTMSLLDEWQAPEPSPYFTTRLQAQLREEALAPRRELVVLVAASGAGSSRSSVDCNGCRPA